MPLFYYTLETPIRPTRISPFNLFPIPSAESGDNQLVDIQAIRDALLVIYQALGLLESIPGAPDLTSALNIVSDKVNSLDVALAQLVETVAGLQARLLPPGG